MIWILITAGYLILLGAVAALCDRLQVGDERSYWEGWNDREAARMDARSAQALLRDAYDKAGVTEADIVALNEWAKTIHNPDA
jgi:hypothetical protein